jgi:hypothetical protein
MLTVSIYYRRPNDCGESDCLRALYFIPNAIQAALFNAIRGLGDIITLPSFPDSFESWAITNALSQDSRIDMKIKLDAECVAAITCA